jgi:membrane-associated protease RseP (regulator of RpoE activity)
VTTAVTGGLIGALWLFEKGHDTAIPPGTAFSVYTVGDTTIDLSLLTNPALAQAGAIPMPNAPAPTSNSTPPRSVQIEQPNADNQAVTVLPRPMASSSMSVPSLGLFVKTRLGLGAEVTGVARGSAAERSGLQVGNIITQIDGKKVQTIRDVSTALENRAPGSEVRLGWIFRTNLGWMPAEEGTLTLSAGNN